MEQRTGPKDVFLHLLSIIALYITVGTMIALLFQYINIAIPDPLDVGYSFISSTYNSIRWDIALLIVVFPVYAWTVWYLNREYKRVPEKREMRSRKWLIYLTLFIAALIIIGDLVALVYNLLRGEFTSRFILKVLTVFVVSGAVFMYYLREVRDVGGEMIKKALTYASILVVAVAIVAGFFIVGSPTEERAFRFDEDRVTDLQSIQGQIVYFWQSKQRLPNNLAELSDSISGFRAPTDPETGVNYVYRKTGDRAFELCATFNRANRSSSKYPSIADPYYREQNWDHEAGEGCFTRTIDPELYPPLTKTL